MIGNAIIAQGLLVDTAALAAVALIGYVFGRRTRGLAPAPTDPKLIDELARAQSIAKELELITLKLRTELAGHQQGVVAFQRQLQQMTTGEATADWRLLGERAERLLAPTLKLATTLSAAYDQIRAQQVNLITFSGSRIDSATGLHNRRSMEEQLEALLTTQAGGKRRLALALFSVNVDDANDLHLRALASLLEECVRGNDFVARYSHDEFVVLMPKTSLAGALVFSERLIRMADVQLGKSVWGGVVESAVDEMPARLLSRADSALYSARTQPQACLYQHTGASLRRYVFETSSTAPTEASGDNPGEPLDHPELTLATTGD